MKIMLTYTPPTEGAESIEAAGLGVKLTDWLPTALAWLLHQATLSWQMGVLWTAVTISNTVL